jgi:hypothetical protein
LSGIINTEQLAKAWLVNSIQYWKEQKIKQSISALELSIHLKKTELAFAFRGFLIEQQYLNILQQLTRNNIFPAKNQLFNIRSLFPYSALLRQLNDFTDYLLLRN